MVLTSGVGLRFMVVMAGWLMVKVVVVIIERGCTSWSGDSS